MKRYNPTDFEILIAERAKQLQNDVLNVHSKSAVARGRRNLANLRNAATSPPGSDSSIWELTMDGIADWGHDDAPTPEEQAAHIALTTFAFHQQSREQRMHAQGFGLGRSVAQLESKEKQGNSEAGPPKSSIRRRFDALITSQSLPELSHHLRGMVGQLRSKNVPLDYGMLAKDLVDFQQGCADDVRRRWGRQYHHIEKETVEATELPETTGNITIEE